MPKLVGYARVSRETQDLQLQLDAIEAAGCLKENIHVDKVSGVKSERKGLEACLDSLEEGDTLIIWRLDRLGRSMSHLVSLIDTLLKKGVRFKSLAEGVIDTTSATGELVFHIFSALSQFERRLIQERTNAGLAAARARGKRGGRKSTSKTDPKVITAQKMHKDHNMPINTICETLKISRATFYRYVNLENGVS